MVWLRPHLLLSTRTLVFASFHRKIKKPAGAGRPCFKQRLIAQLTVRISAIPRGATGHLGSFPFETRFAFRPVPIAAKFRFHVVVSFSRCPVARVALVPAAERRLII